MSTKNTLTIMTFILLCCVGCTTNEPALEPTNTPISTPIPKNDDLGSSPIVLPTPIFISTRIPGSAISLRPDELKQRWLSNALCKPPCWEGIIPGETTAIEAGEILSANPLFTRVEVIKLSSPYDDVGYINFEWNIGDLHRGDALFNNTLEQTVYKITMAIPEIRLGELIEVYGEPTHVFAADSAAVDTGGPHMWRVEIVWLSQGFLVKMATFSEPRIDEHLKFDSIAYFSLNPEDHEEPTLLSFYENAIKWQGYGDFELYSENNQE